MAGAASSVLAWVRLLTISAAGAWRRCRRSRRRRARTSAGPAPGPPARRGTRDAARPVRPRRAHELPPSTVSQTCGCGRPRRCAACNHRMGAECPWSRGGMRWRACGAGRLRRSSTSSSGPGMTRCFALPICAHLLTGDLHTAADLVQESLERAGLRWRRIHRQDDPEGYVRRSILNAHLNYGRRRRRERLVAETPEVASADREPRDEALWLLLAALPRQQRAVLVLRFYEDLTGAGIHTVTPIRSIARSQPGDSVHGPDTTPRQATLTV